MHKTGYMKIAIGILVLGMAFSTVTIAPPQPVTVYGFIHDSNGDPVPAGVQVTIYNTNTGDYYNKTTYIFGQYNSDFSASDGDIVNVSVSYSGEEGSNQTIINTSASIQWCNVTLESGPNHPPDEPTNPSPVDGDTGVDINPILSVDVSDPDGDAMDVYFYNASDDSLIDNDTNVSSGGTASVPWPGLAYNTTYYWYAIANDSELQNQSDTWSFTTIPGEGFDVWVDDDAPPGWYDATHVHTIQEGVDNVTDGGIVHVYDGDYNENVIVNKSVTIQAASTPVVDGMGGTGFNITANNVTIEGFNITNSTIGIKCYYASGFTILNNTFWYDDYGFHWEIDETDPATSYMWYDGLIEYNEFYMNSSDDAIYVDIDLDYDYTAFYDVYMGDLSVLYNTFYMNDTTGSAAGVDFDVDVYELNDGNISVGIINISNNVMYGGYYGIDFYGCFDYLTNVTVTVGNLVINDNVMLNQSSYAMDIDYYDADYWYGTTTGTFGDLIINGNTITSVTTDAIYISDYAYFECFEDEASLTVGNLYIEGNEIDVSGDGIYVYYSYAYELYDNASVTMGEVSIKGNTIDADYGIYLEYYDFGEDMYGNSTVTTGDVHIEDNEIYADSEAIYVYYDYVAYEMEDNANLLMGDIYIEDNEISSNDDGIYLYYYDCEVGCDMYNDAYAELPDYVITGNTFDVEYDGIYLYTYENPYYMYDNATFDFGGFFIDDNTFSCDNGIYFEYDEMCYDNYDCSETIIGDITITNNWFYDLDEEAILIGYWDIGGYLYDESTLDVGDLVIADNVIDGVYCGDGIDVEYWYVYSYGDSTVTMGTLDITGNDISNVDEDGIDIDYCPYAYGNSKINIGRAFIQYNTIEGCGEAGIDMYMDIYEASGATVDIGNAIISDNNISNNGHGIDLDCFCNCTIIRNMIRNNTEGETGVHLTVSSNDNEIHDNCFYDNDPQARDDGTGNNWDGNYWSDYRVEGGVYNISGTAGSKDYSTLGSCPLMPKPKPAKVPALTTMGIIILIGSVSILAVIAIKKKQK